jgi:taurine dioxygenase
MTRVEVEKLAPALGAEVSGVDLSQPIHAATFDEIRGAWLKHLVLRFRGQKLSDPQLLAFSKLFGELDPPGPNPYGKPFLAEHPELNVISNIKNDGVPIGGLGDGEAIWHADMTYVETPPMGAILYALEVPPSGGDTYWANMYTAYEALPARLKKRIDGRQAVHDATYNSAGIMRKVPGRRRSARGPRRAASLVRAHRGLLPPVPVPRRRRELHRHLRLPSEALLGEPWRRPAPSIRSASSRPATFI